jgi:hypothetical protein
MFSPHYKFSKDAIKYFAAKSRPIAYLLPTAPPQTRTFPATLSTNKHWYYDGGDYVADLVDRNRHHECGEE